MTDEHELECQLLDELDSTFVAANSKLVSATGLAAEICWARLHRGLNARLRVASPSDADARTAEWRARFRLYGTANADEPAADSDLELEADQPGSEVYRGLPAVADELRQMAAVHHKGVCIGLEPDTLRHRLKSLRPTLSRRKGNATWRVPYTAPDGEYWARVDLVRLT